MRQLQLPWFAEDSTKISENQNIIEQSLSDNLCVEFDKCPSCDENSFHDWICESCGYWKECDFSKKEKVDITKVLNFDSIQSHTDELLRRLEIKDNCRIWFLLFWEIFDIEIKNWWINRIEISGLTFVYKNWKFIVVSKQKWFLWWNAYKYKRQFLSWLWKQKKTQENNETWEKEYTHPYFDKFLWN